MNTDEAFSKALQLRDAGDLRGAVKLLRELSQTVYDSAALFAVLGGVYWELKELDEAIKCFVKATELAPRSETASLGLFHSLWQQGRESEALDECKRFMALSDSEDYRSIIAEINADNGGDSGVY